jgi:hypothetical protein
MSSSASRKVVQVSEILARKLNWYALAATAAGVGALAIATPCAEAKIIYTKTNVKFDSDYLLDLNNDGVEDFSISFYRTNGHARTSLSARGHGKGNSVVGYKFGREGPWAAALPAGRQIPRPEKLYGHFMAYWQSAGGPFLDSRPPSSSFRWGGQWAGKDGYGLKKPHYLGLKFMIDGKVHYGWASFTTQEKPAWTATATLTGYAYETVPNKPITTGKTKGPDVIAVHPGTLGSLARGRR